MTDRKFVVGRVVPVRGNGSFLVPISDTIRTTAPADQKLTRLLHAAREYRDQRSQGNLTELIEAAKDIE